jgi:DNA polymerase phi
VQLSDEAIISEVLEAPVVQDWFTGAAAAGDPDALFLALKLQERTNIQKEIFGSLLPYPFSPDTFFHKRTSSINRCLFQGILIRRFTRNVFKTFF